MENFKAVILHHTIFGFYSCQAVQFLGIFAKQFNLTLEIERLNAEMTRQRDQMAAMLNAERALNIDIANEILITKLKTMTKAVITLHKPFQRTKMIIDPE